MIAEAETALVQRLRALFPSLAVEPFPDHPASFKTAHPVGTILVCYRSDKFGTPKGLGAIVQDRDITFEVVFIVRNLRTHHGAYALIDGALSGLLGWRAPGFDRTFAERGGFQHQKDGLWQFALFVTMQTMAVEATTEAQAGYGLGEEGLDGLPLSASALGLTSLSYEEQIS